ncbi:MAG TPA: response regulator [Burkholderiales bacterium]|nr:response regulator [Burkholderiales bacterium]
MSDSFSQTAKGKAELSARPGRLAGGLKTLLAMVGEEVTIAELKIKLPQVPADKLAAALDHLVAQGYLQRNVPDAAPADNDLDFTRYFNRPVKEPTLQQKRLAEATLAGLRGSRKPGYYVSIVNRPEQRLAPRSGEKYSVLLIDEDDAGTMLLARALLLAKFETRAAVKREEIIAELNRQPPPDAIAMEIVLPDVGGLELLGRIREHPVLKTVPVIVMTAKVEHDDVVAALAYGASGYMTKPFEPEKLVASVKAVLGL